MSRDFNPFPPPPQTPPPIKNKSKMKQQQPLSEPIGLLIIGVCIIAIFFLGKYLLSFQN